MYLPKEQGVCVETPSTSRAYLQVVVVPAFVPLRGEAYLVCTWLLKLERLSQTYILGLSWKP